MLIFFSRKTRVFLSSDFEILPSKSTLENLVKLTYTATIFYIEHPKYDSIPFCIDSNLNCIGGFSFPSYNNIYLSDLVFTDYDILFLEFFSRRNK